MINSKPLDGEKFQEKILYIVGFNYIFKNFKQIQGGSVLSVFPLHYMNASLICFQFIFWNSLPSLEEIGKPCQQT